MSEEKKAYSIIDLTTGELQQAPKKRKIIHSDDEELEDVKRNLDEDFEEKSDNEFNMDSFKKSSEKFGKFVDECVEARKGKPLYNPVRVPLPLDEKEDDNSTESTEIIESNNEKEENSDESGEDVNNNTFESSTTESEGSLKDFINDEEYLPKSPFYENKIDKDESINVLLTCNLRILGEDTRIMDIHFEKLKNFKELYANELEILEENKIKFNNRINNFKAKLKELENAIEDYSDEYCNIVDDIKKNNKI